MPMYDFRCDRCDAVVDHFCTTGTQQYVCECGGTMQRIWTAKACGVIADSIPGGMWIKHGICNADGTPKRYDSHSEMRRAAEKAGLVNKVVHQGSKGSDKSKHTTRWV